MPDDSRLSRLEFAYAFKAGLEAQKKDAAGMNAKWLAVLEVIYDGAAYPVWDDDQKALAGLAAVQSFLVKLDRWGHSESAWDRMDPSHGGAALAKRSLSGADSRIDLPKFNDVEKFAVSRYYLPEYVRQQLDELDELQLGRRRFMCVLVGIGAAGATAAVSPPLVAGYHHTFGKPDLKPGQVDEMRRKEEEEEGSGAVQIDAQNALAEARKQREDADLSRTAEMMQKWQEDSKIGAVGNVTSAVGGVVALACLGSLVIMNTEEHLEPLRAAERQARPGRKSLHRAMQAVLGHLEQGIDPLLERIARKEFVPPRRTGPGVS